VATFVPTGYRYPFRTQTADRILIYMKPNSPATPYMVVGTIIVTPPAANAQLSSYIAVLKQKAAAIGADGVTSVEATPRTMTSAAGGCIGGSPYYSQSSSTAYDVKGDAFVWADSSSVVDTARLRPAQLDSVKRAHDPSPEGDLGPMNWGLVVGMLGGAALLIALLVILYTSAPG
jgi:hypothetical protein